MGLFDSTAPQTGSGSNPGLLASLLQGSLPAGAAGWLNPGDPSQSTPLSSPAQDQQRLAMAQQLMQQGSSYSPVASPWQGLDRLAQGLIGGYQAGQVARDQSNGQASYQASLAKMLGQGTGDMSIPSTPGFSTPALAAADQQQDAMQDGDAPAPLAAALSAPTPAAPAGPQPAALAAALGGTHASAPSASPGSLPSIAAIQGTPGGSGLSNLFAQQEQAHGLPPGFLAQTAQIESGGNPNAYNKGSGASGLFQVIPSTAKSLGLGNPFDVVASTNAAAQLAGQNAATLTKALGQAPTAGELYLAHQQGAAGAAKLLANPTARAGDLVGDAAVRANGGDPNGTAAQFASRWTSRFDGGSGAPATAVASASPFGSLDASAFATSPTSTGFSGLPLMAASGMGGMLLQATGFGLGDPGVSASLPPATAFAPTPAPAPAAQAITGVAGPAGTVMQPGVVHGYGPTGMGTAPTLTTVPAPPPPPDPGFTSNHTITGAAPTPAPGTMAQPGGAGQAYGSVPVNIGGRMLTRQQAHDSTIPGVDEDTYDNAAEDAGLIKDASAAPPFVSAAAGATGAGPVAGGTAAPSSLAAGLSQAAAAAPAGGFDRNSALALLSNPYTPPAMQQVAASLLERQPQASYSTYTDKDGSVWQRNALTGEVSLKQDNSTSDDNWKLVDIGGRPVEYNSKTGSYRQPDLGGQSGYRPLTAAEKAAYNLPADSGAQMGPDGKITGIGGGTTVNVGADNQTYDKQLADALGKSHAALATGVEDAQARARDLNAMSGALDAIQRNGGTTGFGQSQMLQLKSAVNSGANALGIDQPFDISDPEFLTKFNRQIAGAQAKGAVGSRVTNFEMSNYLKSNPGLEMSPTGNRRLIGIQQQIEQRNIDVGNQIRNATASAISAGRKIDPTQVQGIISSYDQAHHVVDPVTGQDLTQSTVLPEFQGGAPAAPAAAPASTSTPPVTGARKAPDGNWYVSDPDRPGKYLKVQ